MFDCGAEPISSAPRILTRDRRKNFFPACRKRLLPFDYGLETRIHKNEKGDVMQKITPFLWFENNAEEAMKFYTSVFKNAKVGNVARYGDTGPGPKGTVMTAEFSLEGVEFVALNGGPHFKFNEAVSFVVNCETQEEVDYFWEKLSEGGQKSRCGWLKDKFGLAWQITPIILTELINSPDQAKVDRVMKAMMQMDKIEIEPILRAADAR
jgi:predicted 3-demethylubiquinone-9 3-methyltransferase (glyoxalase superfamily)